MGKNKKMNTCDLEKQCSVAGQKCNKCSKQKRINMFQQKRPLTKWLIMDLDTGNILRICNSEENAKYYEEDREYNYRTEIIKFNEDVDHEVNYKPFEQMAKELRNIKNEK